MIHLFKLFKHQLINLTSWLGEFLCFDKLELRRLFRKTGLILMVGTCLFWLFKGFNGEFMRNGEVFPWSGKSDKELKNGQPTINNITQNWTEHENQVISGRYCMALEYLKVNHHPFIIFPLLLKKLFFLQPI